MEDLPHHLILDILGRLPDSADVARCRAASRALNAAARGVTSVALHCSLASYLRSRSPDTRSLVVRHQVPRGKRRRVRGDRDRRVARRFVRGHGGGRVRGRPFKSLVASALRGWGDVKSVAIGIDGSLPLEDMEEDEFGDDMYLMDVGFLAGWPPSVCEGLRALSISDCWDLYCRRRSESNVLVQVSSYCRSLCELELKNAWLSVDGLNPLPSLTSLTLEFIELDDEKLSQLCSCFSLLQVLNLRAVSGLKEPKIHLPYLRSCQWTVSKDPTLAIYAPRLVKLMLKGIKPRSLILETPALSDFDLSIVQADDLQVKDHISLKSLKLSSPFLCNLITAFPSGKTVEKLTLNTEYNEDVKEMISLEMISLELLFKTFPNASTLTLGPGAWSRLCRSPGGWEDVVEMKSLQGIVACTVGSNIDVAQFIASMMDKCTNLSDFTILVQQQHADSDLLSNLTKRYTADWPRLKWKFGVFKEAAEVYGFTGDRDIVWQRNF